MSIIQVDSLCKHFKKNPVLKDISFQIKEGQCVALIGPNGAGKTTLMSCLIGDLLATSGNILLDGLEANDASLKRKIGVLPQENKVPNQLKVKELIQFFRSIHQDALSEEEIQQLLCFSNQQYNQMAGDLSGGQKRMLSFVLTLIGKPKILFLDEPTASMDTSTRKRFWEIVDELKSKNMTIVYSSHYVEEVEHTADRILVLHNGELLRDTTSHRIRMEDTEKQFVVPKHYKEQVKQFEHIFEIKEELDSVSFKTRAANAVWKDLEALGVTIQEIEVMNKSLLDTIFEKIGEQ